MKARHPPTPTDSVEVGLEAELLRYSRLQGYPSSHYAHARCRCSSNHFKLYLDDREGCAVRVCLSCGHDHFVADSQDYLQDAELAQCVCRCGQEHFRLALGVALYRGSEDVRWAYLACHCPSCGLIGVYGDWKSEFVGYRDFLAKA